MKHPDSSQFTRTFVVNWSGGFSFSSLCWCLFFLQWTCLCFMVNALRLTDDCLRASFRSGRWSLIPPSSDCPLSGPSYRGTMALTARLLWLVQDIKPSFLTGFLYLSLLLSTDTFKSNMHHYPLV